MNIKYILIILTLLLLMLSLAFNLVFYKKAFIPLHAVRLDPLGLNYYPFVTKSEKGNQSINKPFIMFYGDSRGLSWPIPDDDNYDFINRSIGNQTSKQIIGRFGKDVAPYKPNIIIIQMCVNDLKMIPLFSSQKSMIIKGCKDRLLALVNQAHQIDAQVILTTVFPLGNVSIARNILGIREQPIINAIDEINRYIKTLASEKTIIFDSYYFLAAKDRKIQPKYSHDWLHLNNHGYQILNHQLKTLLKNIDQADQ